MATSLLVLGLISLFGTFTALFFVRPLAWFMPIYFLSSWLQGELAPWHLLWQTVVATLLVAAGALDQTHGQWGLFLLLLSFAGLLYVLYLSFKSEVVYEQALQAALGKQFRDIIPAERRHLLEAGIDAASWMRPFSMRRAGVKRQVNLSYGEAGERNLLDVYYPEVARRGGSPVLLQVHGGAWIIGHKQQQAQPLMNYLVARGWVCVDINYRLSPKSRFPDHIIDVKKAIAWIKTNIAEFGGNPDFVAISGGSAGGHLSSLAALTANLPEFQPGFEAVDTRLQAAVPFYGVYDWNASLTPGDEDFRGFIMKNVMPKLEEPALTTALQQASPVNYVNASAPPMFFIHGNMDALAKVEDARVMVRELSAVATAPVAYAEVPGAQHAFEIFHSVRCDMAVQAAFEFLEWAHASHRVQAEQTTAAS